MSDPFIKIFNSKFSTEFCDKVIDLFEKEEFKKLGLFGKGVHDDTIKDTIDFKIPSINATIDKNTVSLYQNEWYEIDNHVHDTLSPSISEYVTEINNTLDGSKPGLCYIVESDYNDTGHQIQKYTKNKGHYKSYHNDFSILPGTNYYRILTYIIYLNTIDEGGETSFFGKNNIKPVAGNMIIFPASWMYPHCGNMPISDNKYIITGWIYACAQSEDV